MPGRPISRVLSIERVCLSTVFEGRIIYLGASLPIRSSGLPGTEKKASRFPLPGGSSRPCLTLLRLRVTWPLHCCKRRWSLAPPFHPYPCGRFVFLWPDLAGSSEESPPRVLPGSLPCGVRTFLEVASNLAILWSTWQTDDTFFDTLRQPEE